jgi:hypothetical protein
MAEISAVYFFCKFCPNGKAGETLTEAAAEANGAVPWPLGELTHAQKHKGQLDGKFTGI